MMRAIVRSVLKATGLRLVRLPAASEYGAVLPEANYAPWNTDSEFLATYGNVRNNTLVDIYRCWELWTLIGQTAKLDPGAVLEVGVWRGGTGALMAKRAALLAGPQSAVYLCDTFEGVVKAGEQDTYYKGGEHADTGQEIVENLLQSLRLKNVRLIKGIFPDQMGSLLDDVRFRLVHIDVDTYQSAKDVMEWVWSRMVPGGIVVYDDYGFKLCEGIKKLVNEQAKHADKLVLHNLNGHAIVVKTGPATPTGTSRFEGAQQAGTAAA